MGRLGKYGVAAGRFNIPLREEGIRGALPSWEEGLLKESTRDTVIINKLATGSLAPGSLHIASVIAQHTGSPEGSASA